MKRKQTTRAWSEQTRLGFSLMEVIAAVSLATAVAITVVPYLVRPADETKHSVCKLHQERLNLEIALYRHKHGHWPTLMSQVTSDGTRFPDGPLVCPITNAAYDLAPGGDSVTEHSH